MAETTTASPAANIADAIHAKANGKVPTPAPEVKGKEKEAAAAPDPNAGKEKYVVNGQDKWLTPDEARRYAQKGMAFEPKMAELNRLQAETQQFLNTLKNEPEKILFNPRIGLTPKQVLGRIFANPNIAGDIKEDVGQWYWNNVVQIEKMTPEQREAFEAKRKLSEYEKREVMARESAIQLDNERRKEQAMGQIKANIAEAMKQSGLPSNDTPLGVFMARRVADVMRLGFFQHRTVTPQQAIDQVRSELKGIQSAWYDSLDEENLVKELGETNADKVKKYFLKIAKEAGKQPPVQKGPSTPKGERKTKSLDDFHDYLEQRKRGQ